ncbi:MAG: GNAT family N-acetyltransferase [Sphingobacteriaceae bacterium]|nr:GNAT family N-acetyltransferase [Sphingobacteriaceae bacterium]
MITLRKFEKTDLLRIVELLNNPNVSQFTSDRIPYPYTESNAEKFLEIALTSNGAQLYAIILDGLLIGGVGIHPQELNLNRNVELGYWIGEEFWGNGYAYEAAKLAVTIAFKNHEIHKIMARTMQGNIASEKILITLGFKLEGELKEHIFKRGKFLNEKYWGLLKSNYKT